MLAPGLSRLQFRFLHFWDFRGQRYDDSLPLIFPSARSVHTAFTTHTCTAFTWHVRGAVISDLQMGSGRERNGGEVEKVCWAQKKAAIVVKGQCSYFPELSTLNQVWNTNNGTKGHSAIDMPASSLWFQKHGGNRAHITFLTTFLEDLCKSLLFSVGSTSQTPMDAWNHNSTKLSIYYTFFLYILTHDKV